MRPIWIESELFEGHQGHWSDCFFSNATRAEIESYLTKEGEPYVIREMTEQELKQYPEAEATVARLIAEYGEA